MVTDPNDTGEFNLDVARRLRQTRVALGYQQYEFAQEIGIGNTNYNQLETGKRKITVDSLMAIVNRFPVTTDWILLGEPSGLRVDIFEKIRNADV